jgi:hypothetical protein
VHYVNAGLPFEQFARKEAAGTGAGRTVGHFTGPGLRHPDEIADRLRGRRRRHHDNRRTGRELRHCSEITHQVVAEVFLQAGIDGMRRGDLNHRVTVGGSVRSQVRADIAAGAGTVVHDHLVTEDRAQAFGNDA